MSTTIDTLQIEIQASATSASKALDQLSSSLTTLKSNAKLTAVTNNLTKLKDSLAGLSGSMKGLDNIAKIGTALSSLSGFKSSGLTSTLNSLQKIPAITASLDSSTISAFSKRIKDLNAALIPLGTTLNSVGSGFAKLPNNVKKASTATGSLVTENDKLAASNNKVTLSLDNLAVKFGIVYLAAQQVYQVIGGWVNSVNEYIENVNLFTVSMGEYYEQAAEYATLVEDKLGIDSSEFMRNQGIFMSMATGFGLASEQAYKLSKGLTEVSYDISSFFNVPIEEAFLKVRSGLAGELEPLRALGYALSEASLQQVAFEHGINQSIGTMTEAQKSMLRYTAIVEQSARMGAIGDMAKTLQSPSNAIRILVQQLKQLARALGSVFLPIIQQVIPYVQAFVKVLTDLIRRFAVFVGFEMPDWSNSDWNSKVLGGAASAASDLGTGLDDATKSAKALKDVSTGFDELNVISPETPSSSSASGAGGGVGLGGDLGIDIEDVWNAALLDEIDSQVDSIVEKFKEFYQSFVQYFIDPLKTIDIEPLKESLKNLWDALVPFGQTIGAGLYWFYINVLVPLAKWTIEDVLPAFINGLAAGLNWLNPALKEFGNWIVTNIGSIKTITELVVSFLLAWKLSTWIMALIPGITTIGGLFTSIGAALGGVTGIFSGFGAIVAQIGVRISALIVTFNAGGGGLAGILSVIGSLATSAGSAFAGFAATLSPIALIVVALGSAIYVLWQNWEKVLGVFKTFIEKLKLKEKFDEIRKAVEPLMEKLAGLKDLFTVIGTIVAGALAIAMGVVAGLFKALLNVIAPVIKILGGFIDILAGVGQIIVGVFTLDLGKAYEGVQNIFSGIVDVFAGLGQAIWGILSGFVSGVIDWFVSLWDTLVGHSIVPDTIEAIVDWFKKLPGFIFDILKSFVSGVVTFFKSMWTSITTTFAGIANWFGSLFLNAWTNIKNAWSTVVSWFSNIRTNINAKFSSVGTWFKDKFVGAWNNIKNAWSSVASWFGNVRTNINSKFSSVNTWFKDKFKAAWTNVTNIWKGATSWFGNVRTNINSKFSSIGSWFKDKFQGAYSNVTSVFNKLPGFFSGIWDKIKETFSALGTKIGNAISGAVKSGINGVLSGIERTINYGIDLINGAIDTINLIPGVNIGKMGKLSFPRLAEGGLLNTGQMFIANEAGPELVGNYGSQTAVMNNEQIVQAVSRGVFDAVVSAMAQGTNNETESNNSFHLYLDGKEITAVVEKRQSEKGKQLLGSQLGYNY